jgi:hypothetical protein
MHFVCLGRAPRENLVLILTFVPRLMQDAMRLRRARQAHRNVKISL